MKNVRDLLSFQLIRDYGSGSITPMMSCQSCQDLSKVFCPFVLDSSRRLRQPDFQPASSRTVIIGFFNSQTPWFQLFWKAVIMN